MNIPGKKRFLPDMSLNAELVLLVSTNATGKKQNWGYERRRMGAPTKLNEK